jgi:hypothetical protein
MHNGTGTVNCFLYTLFLAANSLTFTGIKSNTGSFDFYNTGTFMKGSKTGNGSRNKRAQVLVLSL